MTGRRPNRGPQGRRNAPAAARSPAPVREPQSSEDAIEVEGTVIEQLRNATFRVAISGEHQVLAHTAGKMRKFRIRIMPGDRVVVALTPYDLTRGRIVYRYK